MSNKNGAIIIEGHVQGLSNTRSLGRSGVPVIVVDNGDCVARYSKYCRGFYKCPAYNSDDLADFLIRLARERGLKDWLLLPSNDHAVLTLSRNRIRLEDHFKLITPGLEIIENIYDKSRLLDIAIKAGLPIPPTYYADSPSPENVPLLFPVITRGRFGLDFCKTTGRKAFLAKDIQELREQFAWIDRVFPLEKTLTQELIPDEGTNKTISFCAFCENGEIKTFWMGAKLREHPIRFGTATLAQSVYIEECYQQSIPRLKAINYSGVCEVEYLMDPRDSQYKLIEINARTWLWVGLAKACGVDFARIAYDYVNKMALEYPTRYVTDIKWINYITDSFMMLKQIKGSKLHLVSYLQSIRGKKVNAFFEKNDPCPGLMFLVMLPYMLKKRFL